MTAPTDIILDRTLIAEGAPAGAVVGRLSAIDPDADDTFSYALVADDASPWPDMFEIVGNELRLQEGATLDYEAVNSYQITVKVTDSSGNAYPKDFTIEVADLNEVTERDPNGYLSGTSGNDLLEGTSDYDPILGGAGDDLLKGNGGDDYLSGEAGTDLLHGGNGNDTLYGDTQDRLYGGEGNDWVASNTGTGLLDGGNGQDSIHGFAETIFGGAGNDDVHLVGEGPAAPTLIDGGDDFDTIEVFHSSEYLDFSRILNFERILVGTTNLIRLDDATTAAGATLEVRTSERSGAPIWVDGSAETDAQLILGGGEDVYGGHRLSGGQLSDTLRGSHGQDTLQGNGGDDRLEGGDDIDTAVYSGNFSDYTISQGDGFVTVNGPDGTDTLIRINRLKFDDQTIELTVPGLTLTGGASADVLDGSDGADVLDGQGGDDTLFGQTGDDLLQGHDGNDVAYGGLGDDQLHGGAGRDQLRGDEGADVLYGEAGDDWLETYAYSQSEILDALYGGDGRDVLSGQGAILMDGGGGHDQINGDADVILGGEGSDSVVVEVRFYHQDESRSLPTRVDGGEGRDSLTLTHMSEQMDFSQVLNFEDFFIHTSNLVRLEDATNTATGTSYIYAYGEGSSIDASAETDADLIFLGSHGRDTLIGGDGSDIFYGRQSDDVLVGGGGRDVVRFDWYRDDYTVIQNEDGSVTVTGGARGYNGRSDGSDRLESIERLQFADGPLYNLDGTPVSAPPPAALDASSVDENSAGSTLVGVLSAGGPDAGHTFSLLDNGGGRFEIVNGNEVVVVEGAVLDFEGQASHQITVRVTNADGLYTDQTLAIELVDLNEAPTAPVLTGSTVLEGSAAETVVGKLSATDPDTGDTLTYSLADDAGGLFVLVGNQLQVAEGSVLDFETAQSHQITIEVSDAGGQVRTELFTIAVQDIHEQPDPLSFAGGEVEENADAGTVVATVEGVDSGSDDNVAYSLLDDGGSRFVIDETTGVIMVAEGAALDFEDASSHDIIVQVIDGDVVREATLTVEVTNVDEAPSDIELVDGGTVEEGAAAGTVVASLTATDPDGTSAFSWALVGNADGLFEVADGQIVVAEGAVLDFGTQRFHDITVEVSDEGGLSCEETFTIEVTNVNEAPTDITIVAGSSSVKENAAEGTMVAQLGAVDGDPDETFTFEVFGANGMFVMDGDTLRVAADAQIDYEGGGPRHDVLLTVTDGSGASYSEELHIQVDNVSGSFTGSSVADSLVGTSEEDWIGGLGGNDTLSGLEGDDRLSGDAGHDRLIGGEGADTLLGGLNNDTYVLTGTDAVEDTITEAAGQGTDTVQTDADYTLAANVETLVLTGTGDLQGFGNELNNTLTGNSGSNVLGGGLGADTMNGGQGDDVYHVDNVGDRTNEVSGAGLDEIRTTLASLNISLNGMTNVENLTYEGASAFTGTGNTLANVITGAGGNDVLNGGAGNDLLAGNEGADSFDGGTGDDQMLGGAGNDTYVVNAIGDQVIEEVGGGTDTVRSAVSLTLAAEVEALVLTGTAGLSGTGNELDNTLTGNSGINTLDGGEGADILIGGAGSDIYLVDDAGDTLTEAAGAGTDTVRTTAAAFSLESNANVENLTIVGGGDFQGTGNALVNTMTGGGGLDQLFGLGGNDVLMGQAGADTLDGGLGADSMTGGLGDDRYVVDATTDRITEATSQGRDEVVSSVSLTLGSNLEDLTLVGTVNGTGNGLANTLTGSAQANSLSGAGGNDRLVGEGGNDILSGGTGLDTFVFAPSFGADRVSDFDFNPTGGQDYLDLTAFGITADTFSSRVSLDDLGADILVTVDGDPNQSIQLTNAQLRTNITAQDFLLSSSLTSQDFLL